MSAPYEKAKLAGYDVQQDGSQPGDGYHVIMPNGDDLAATYGTEDDAWKAADHHRMFGEAMEPPAREWLVTWETNEYAVTAQQAAEQARGRQRPGTSALVFKCEAEGVDPVTVDLADEEGVER